VYIDVEKRGDCREDGLLHSLERFIEKIRPKEKAEKKKGGKSCWQMPLLFK
jgi:hypothetical protein